MEQSYKKIDFNRKPIKTRWYLQPIIWLVVNFMLLSVQHKIIKENFKRIKGGCLIVSNHMCFTDFKLLEKFLFPRRSYYISSIDDFVYKEWIMRRLGCIPKKVHYRDMSIIRKIPQYFYNLKTIRNHKSTNILQFLSACSARLY